MKKTQKGRHEKLAGHDPPAVEERVHDPPKTPQETGGQNEAMSAELEQVARWLKRVRFKKAVIGGVDEADVWKKLAELNGLYETALAAERVRYDALLDERVHTMTAEALRRLSGQQRTPSQAREDAP